MPSHLHRPQRDPSCTDEYSMSKWGNCWQSENAGPTTAPGLCFQLCCFQQAHRVRQPFSPLRDAILFSRFTHTHTHIHCKCSFRSGAAVQRGRIVDISEFIIHIHIYIHTSLALHCVAFIICEIALKWPNKTTINMACTMARSTLGSTPSRTMCAHKLPKLKTILNHFGAGFPTLPLPTHLNNSADTRHTFIFITFHTARHFGNTLH